MHDTMHLATRSGAEHDVIVVGARCAGAATALLLARQGLDVLVVDRAALPSDTLSTHALARGGVVQLDRWGLLDDVVASGAPPIRTVTFHSGDMVVEKAVKDRAGVQFLLAPRRHVLDTILAEAATDAGAHLLLETAVTAVRRDATGRVTGVWTRAADGTQREHRARFVVGADGVRSRTARSVGAATIDERPSPNGTAYLYVADLDSAGFEFHLGAESRFAGVFPTHAGEANVFVCAPAVEMPVGARAGISAFLDLLGRTSPSLAARVARARITSPVRAAVGLPNVVRQPFGPGWALVGDAGYHRDPITGHGMTDAFRDAELLARAIGDVVAGRRTEAQALDGYASERLDALRPIFEITCRLVQAPPPDEFTVLQKALSDCIEREALALAALPSPTARVPVAA
jgi:2-polyprenyl-6-methoxyphenol hydroxylase-like FAD-dependent oxidoreductase